MKRMGDIRVQVDRWPFDTQKKTPHILTVIVACMFDEKPDKAAIVNALRDATAIFVVQKE